MRTTSKNNQQVIIEKHKQHFTHILELLVEPLQRKPPTVWGNSFTIRILNR